MTAEALSDSLRDVAAGVLTPFDDDARNILHDEVAANARFLYERGIRLFLACANVSEYHSLSHDERIAVVRSVVEALPDDATVLAGAGGSTETVESLADAYADVGADALMVMSPDHTWIHEQGLVEYFKRLASASDIPLVPYIRDVEPTPETVAAIADLDGVAGMKYALADTEAFARAVAAADEDTVWVCGMGEPPVPAFWAEGVEGFTSGVGNIRPSVGLALFDALQNEDWGRAREIRNVTLPFQRLRGEAGEDNCLSAANSIPVLKYGLELAGAYGGPVREPLVELSERDRKRVEAAYERVDRFVETELGPQFQTP